MFELFSILYNYFCMFRYSCLVGDRIDYDYVFLNVLKLPEYPFWGFVDYFYKTMMFYMGLRFCLQMELCRIFSRFLELKKKLESRASGLGFEFSFFKRAMIS